MNPTRDELPTAVVLEFTLTQNAEADIRNAKLVAVHNAIRKAFEDACVEQDIDGALVRRLRSMTPKRFEAWGRRTFGRGRA